MSLLRVCESATGSFSKKLPDLHSGLAVSKSPMLKAARGDRCSLWFWVENGLLKPTKTTLTIQSQSCPGSIMIRRVNGYWIKLELVNNGTIDLALLRDH